MMELNLVRDGVVIFSMPLGCETPQAFHHGQATEEEFVKLASIYSLGSNPRRLRIMQALAKRGEMKFTELMDFAMNPKLLRDCVNPMIREGMVIHEKKGSCYKMARNALPIFLTLTLALRSIISAVEEESGRSNPGTKQERA